MHGLLVARRNRFKAQRRRGTRRGYGSHFCSKIFLFPVTNKINSLYSHSNSYNFSVYPVLTGLGYLWRYGPQSVAWEKKKAEGLGRVLRYANKRKIRKSFGVLFLVRVKCSFLSLVERISFALALELQCQRNLQWWRRMEGINIGQLKPRFGFLPTMIFVRRLGIQLVCPPKSNPLLLQIFSSRSRPNGKKFVSCICLFCSFLLLAVKWNRLDLFASE